MATRCAGLVAIYWASRQTGRGQVRPGRLSFTGDDQNCGGCHHGLTAMLTSGLFLPPSHRLSAWYIKSCCTTLG